MKNLFELSKKMLLPSALIIMVMACNQKKAEPLTEAKTMEKVRDTIIQERNFITPYYAQQASISREDEEMSNAGSNEEAQTTVAQNSTQTTETKKKGMSNKAKGAMIGAGVGAVTGAVVSKKRGKGAIIGAVAGAAVGLGVGAVLDKKKKDSATK